MNRSNMEVVTDMLAEIAQAVVAIVVIGGGVYLSVIGRQVPAELWAFGGMIVGYYFQRTNARTQERATERAVVSAMATQNGKAQAASGPGPVAG